MQPSYPSTAVSTQRKSATENSRQLFRSPTKHHSVIPVEEIFAFCPAGSKQRSHLPTFNQKSFRLYKQIYSQSWECWWPCLKLNGLCNVLLTGFVMLCVQVLLYPFNKTRLKRHNALRSTCVTIIRCTNTGMELNCISWGMARLQATPISNEQC